MLVRSGNDVLVKYKSNDVFAQILVMDYGNVTEFQLTFPDGHFTTLLYNHEIISEVSPWTEVGLGSSDLARETGDSLISFIDYLNGKEIDFAVKKNEGLIMTKLKRKPD